MDQALTASMAKVMSTLSPSQLAPIQRDVEVDVEVPAVDRGLALGAEERAAVGVGTERPGTPQRVNGLGDAIDREVAGDDVAVVESDSLVPTKVSSPPVAGPENDDSNT